MQHPHLHLRRSSTRLLQQGERLGPLVRRLLRRLRPLHLNILRHRDTGTELVGVDLELCPQQLGELRHPQAGLRLPRGGGGAFTGRSLGGGDRHRIRQPERERRISGAAQDLPHQPLRGLHVLLDADRELVGLHRARRRTVPTRNRVDRLEHLVIEVERVAGTGAHVGEVVAGDDEPGLGESHVSHQARVGFVHRIHQRDQVAADVGAPQVPQLHVSPVAGVRLVVRHVDGGQQVAAGLHTTLSVHDTSSPRRIRQLIERHHTAQIVAGTPIQGVHDAARLIAFHMPVDVAVLLVFGPEVDGHHAAPPKLGDRPIRVHHVQERVVGYLLVPHDPQEHARQGGGGLAGHEQQRMRLGGVGDHVQPVLRLLVAAGDGECGRVGEQQVRGRVRQVRRDRHVQAFAAAPDRLRLPPERRPGRLDAATQPDRAGTAGAALVVVGEPIGGALPPHGSLSHIGEDSAPRGGRPFDAGTDHRHAATSVRR